jgi:phytoene dehydrogenase-like protein
MKAARNLFAAPIVPPSEEAIMSAKKQRVVVVGAGLAGLSAAAYAAKAGHRVTVVEKASAPGGRAATQDEGGYLLNLGPHALYRGGLGEEVLRELGVEVRGASPPVGGLAIDHGKRSVLPVGFVTMLTTSLLPLGAKLDVAKLLGGLDGIDPRAIAGETVEAFLASRLRAPEARAFAAAMIRLSTYADAPAELSAGTAIAQLRQAAKHNVLYLDGGWRALVEGLRAAAVRAGAEVIAGVKVEAVERDARGPRAVRLAGDRSLPADRVILAASPAAARALLPGVASVAAWEAAAQPVYASALDVALSRLPDPRTTFAIGVDRPLYFSVHSSVARLAPEGGAVIHVARYGRAPDAAAVERELEGLLDQLQPGWRDAIVARRFPPSLVVAHDLPRASMGGLAGRPGPRVPGAPGVLVAGDWVGPSGLLAEASLASARAAARAITDEELESERFSAGAIAG